MLLSICIQLTLISDRQTAYQYVIMGIVSKSESISYKGDHLDYKAIGNVLIYIIDIVHHKFSNIPTAVAGLQVGSSTLVGPEIVYVRMYKFVLYKLKVIYSLDLKDEERRNSVVIVGGRTNGSEENFAESNSDNENCVNYTIDDDVKAVNQIFKALNLIDFLSGMVMKLSETGRYQS